MKLNQSQSLVSYDIYRFLFSYFLLANARHGMRARIATQRLVLNKLLVVSKGELYNRDVGQIINLISNDVQKFDAVCFLRAAIIEYVKIISY